MSLHLRVGSEPFDLPWDNIREIHENATFECDQDVTLRWREVGDGPNGPVEGPWNELLDASGRPLLLSRGANLAHPGDLRLSSEFLQVSSFGRRLTTGAFEVEVKTPAGETATVKVRPVVSHLSPAEISVMIAELEDDDLAWDGRAAGIEGPETEREHLGEEVRIPGRRRHSRAPTPWEQAHELLRLWPALQDLLDRACAALPTQPLMTRRRGPTQTLRQDRRSLEQNLKEGWMTVQGDELVNRHPRVHGLQPGRTVDTPAAAELLRSATELNQLRQRVVQSMRLRRQHNKARQSLEQRYQLDAGPIARELKAQYVRLSDLIQAMETLEALRLPKTIQGLRSAPSRSTASALYHPAHKAWYRAADELARICRAHFAPVRLKRLERTARRQTWHLYEIWMTRRIAAMLVRLGFRAQQSWASLESEEGSLYGLQEGGSLTFTHLSGLEVRLTVEPSLPNDGGAAYRPDLLLELGGNTRDDRLQPLPLIPLMIDAKLRRLAWPRHLPAVQNLVDQIRSKYRAGWHAHCPEAPQAMQPMIYVCVPSPLVDDRHAPWSLWPIADLEGQPPEGLNATDLPYLTGVLNLHPHPAEHPDRLDDPDLRRVLLAWLTINRIFWICPRCGENLTRFSDRKLHKLARNSPRGDPGCAEPRIGYVTTAAGVVERRAKRVLMPQNLHVACPTCEGLMVISHCGRCRDEREQRPPIHKYFGSFSRPFSEADPDEALWDRIEITRPGVGRGNEARWNRPCPNCGRSARFSARPIRSSG